MRRTLIQGDFGERNLLIDGQKPRVIVSFS
jgi:hypothetical protein